MYGLFLDGAGWDKRNSRLIESTNKVLFTLLPVVWIFAINSTAPKDPKLYVVSLYKFLLTLYYYLIIVAYFLLSTNYFLISNDITFLILISHIVYFKCPVYKKKSRTDLNYITPLWLETVKPPEHWILRGVALLCDIK